MTARPPAAAAALPSDDSGFFPDRSADVDAAVPSSLDLAPALQAAIATTQGARRRRRLRAWVIAIGAIAITALVSWLVWPGFLGVACAVAVVWAMLAWRRLMGGVNRRVTAWASERGLRSAGDAALHHWIAPLDDHAQPADIDYTVRTGAEGALWTEAPEAAIVELALKQGKQFSLYSTIVVPLPAEVAARYPGVELTIGTTDHGLRPGGADVAFSWDTIEFERAPEALGVHVAVAERQDPVAVWELFDPAFLLQLSQVRDQVTLPSVHLLVFDGRLYVSQHMRSLSALALASKHDRDAPRRIRMLGQLNDFLRVGRLVHRRLLREGR